MAGENAELLLSEAADLLTGFPFASESYSDGSDDLRLLRGDNVVQGKVRWEGVKRWPVSRVASLEQYVLRPGDVVVAMDRPWIDAGLKYATLTEEDSPSLLVQRVARLRAKEGVLQQFLGYIIGSREFTDYVLGIQTGTAVPHISPSAIKRFRFRCPPLDQQDRIARLLGALDEKIENNRQMSQTLEEIARALFESWFVNFDPVRQAAAGEDTGLPPHIAALFPARLTGDGLPEGWQKRPVGDVFDIVAGNTPSTEDERFWGGFHVWTTPRDLSRLSSPVLLVSERTLSDEGLAACSSGLLPRGTLLLSSRAPIGYLGFADTPTAINQGIAAFRQNGLSTSFAWAWCQAEMSRIKAHANGSTFLEISKGSLRRLPMIQASELVMQAFVDLVDPLVERIVTIARENVTLATIRDTLLPKLISGELRIREAEKIAENA